MLKMLRKDVARGCQINGVSHEKSCANGNLTKPRMLVAEL
jgi:hypothetical protein